MDDIPTYLYLNFLCNSNCLFCASDETNTQKEKKDISLDNIKKIFSAKYFESRHSTTIIVSGGEPTTHKDLIPILHHIKGKFKQVCLMTNGVKLANRNYLNALINSGVSFFSTPLYGDREIHNYLTMSKWYDHTVLFLRNILERKQHSENIHVDVKLLFTKYNYKSNPSLAKQLAATYGKNFSYSLNGLFRSEKTIVNGAYMPFSKIKKYVTQTVHELHKLKIPIRLSFIPLCSIEQSLLKEILLELYAQTMTDNRYVYYIRPDSDEILQFANECYEAPECKECDVYEICTKFSGINAQYFDYEPTFPIKL